MSSGQEVGQIFGDGAGPAAALLRSPTVIIAGIALWGMNVCLFRLFGIDYVYVLTLDLRKEEEDQHARKLKSKINKKTKTTKRDGVIHTQVPTNEEDLDRIDEQGENGETSATTGSEVEMTGLSMVTPETTEDSEESLVNISLIPDSPSSKEAKVVVSPSTNDITEVKLVGLAATLITTLYLTQYLWIQVGKQTTISAIFCFYAIVLVGILMPFPSTNWIRSACKIVFSRAGALLKPRCSCVHGKPKPVPFIDVFFADGMCSMSKVRLKKKTMKLNVIYIFCECKRHTTYTLLIIILYPHFIIQGFF